MRPFSQRSASANVCFENRTYSVARGVFHPAAHLSGVLFATHLADREWANRRVVEVGTGCGLLAGVLADRGASVVATDVSTAAARCAAANLADTSVEVRQGDLLDPIAGEYFDVLVANPPYEIGRALRPRYRSPDYLERLAAQWPSVADELVLAFPTDSAEVLDHVGFDLTHVATLSSTGRDLGVFHAKAS